MSRFNYLFDHVILPKASISVVVSYSMHMAKCGGHKGYNINITGIQFNLLLRPYPCFISLLYLDLYVLGDDALIS